MSNTNQKIETLNKLRTTEAIYVLMSSCTRMPYVVCDPETFDDEILLYYTEAEAKEEAMKLQKEGNPMQLVKVDENSRLSFFTGLFPMGVNCILVDKGLDGQITVQLDELITRPKDEELPEGKIRVENPELVLTAAYFMQQMGNACPLSGGALYCDCSGGQRNSDSETERWKSVSANLYGCAGS